MCLCIPHINFIISESIFMKLGVLYHSSGASLSGISLCLYPNIVARQRLGKHVTKKHYWTYRLLCILCLIKG
jgi:hypothetical protein